jgi:hypothetical protein
MNEVKIIRDGVTIQIILDSSVQDDDFGEVIQDAMKAVTGFNWEVTKP